MRTAERLMLISADRIGRWPGRMFAPLTVMLTLPWPNEMVTLVTVGRIELELEV